MTRLATVLAMVLGLCAGVGVSGLGGLVGCACGVKASFDEIPVAAIELSSADAATLGMREVLVDIRESTVVVSAVPIEGPPIAMTFDRQD